MASLQFDCTLEERSQSCKVRVLLCIPGMNWVENIESSRPRNFLNKQRNSHGMLRYKAFGFVCKSMRRRCQECPELRP